MPNDKNPFRAAPFLMAFPMAGMILLRLVGARLPIGIASQATLSLLILTAFGLAEIAFFFFGRAKSNPPYARSVLCFRRLSGQEAGLLLSTAALLCALSGLFCDSLGDADTMVFFSAAVSRARSLSGIFFLCFLPALAEEGLMRGILLFEYRYLGFGAVFMSALCAMCLPLRFAAMPRAFLCAAALGVAAFAAGNLWVPVLANALCRAVLLFAEVPLSRVASHSESATVLRLGAALLLTASALSVLFFAEGCLRARAARNDPSPHRVPRGHFRRVLRDLFSVPMLWVNLLLFLIPALLDAFSA